MPQGRGSREGDPADQARHHDALRHAVRKSRVTTEAQAAPREYRWRMPANWWTRQRHYFLYILREFTALPMALWLIWLLYEIRRAGGGAANYYPPRSAGFAAFSVFVVRFSLFHNY